MHTAEARKFRLSGARLGHHSTQQLAPVEHQVTIAKFTIFLSNSFSGTSTNGVDRGLSNRLQTDNPGYPQEIAAFSFAEPPLR